MELGNKETMSSTRKTIQFTVQNPDMSRLKGYASELPEELRDDFKKTYGKLLELLDVKVQVGAITALAQYYDRELRCFTFSNFQLAPAPEEFALILGQPLPAKPYHYRGKYPSVERVVQVLGIDSYWLNNRTSNRKVPKGISRLWLEELMKKLIQERKWETLADVLALAIYDLVLFPTSGDLVSLAAADVFIARKCRGENSTFPLLADMYYTLNFCHEHGGKKIMCCIPVLYVWLAAHVLKKKNHSYCPLSELTNMGSQTYTNKEWKQIFMELNEDSVRWFSLATSVVSVLFSCGKFPNVPLVGTLGCINYNPILASRQLRYSMTGPPAEELLSSFTADLGDEVMLDKIRKAWKNVTYKELGKRGTGAAATYKEWVRNRVERIKLPFRTLTPKPVQETDTIIEESDEVKVLKGKLVRSEIEKGQLEAELKEVRLTLEALKLQCSEKDQSLERANKRARVEKNARYRISETNQELKETIARCGKAVENNELLKTTLGELEQQVAALKTQISKQEAQHIIDRRFDEQTYTEIIRGYQDHLEEKQLEVQKLTRAKEAALEENWQLREEVADLEAARAETQRHLIALDLKIKETRAFYVAEYEEKIRNIKLEFSGTIHRLRSAIERKDEELRSLGNWAQERSHLLGLIKAAEVNYIEAWYRVAHWAHKLKDVRRIPGLVRNAEAMINPLSTPREVIELIGVCKGLVETFEGLVEEAKKDVVKEFADLVV